MTRSLAGASLALFLFFLGGPLAAQVEDFEIRRSSAKETLIEELWSYAEWCRGRKLFFQRKLVLEEILALDSDHDEAHKGLGHKKDKQGSWNPPEKTRIPKDFDKKSLEKAGARREAALRPFLDEMETLVFDEGLSHEQFQIASDDFLCFAPDHAVLRERRGEVEHDGAWVLKETAAAVEGRRVLIELVTKGLSSAPEPETVDPEGKERELGLVWTRVLATPSVRVLVTGSDAEARKMVRALHAAEFFFHETLGPRGELPPGGTVFLLSSAGEKEVFLSNYPGLSSAEQTSYASMEGAGLGTTGDFVFWAKNEDQRIDGIVRIALGWIFADAFGLKLEDAAWAYEGFGLYMTRALVNTRLNWFVQPSDLVDAKEDMKLRAALLEPDSNWMQTCQDMIESGQASSLETLFTKGAHELSTQDMLMAYVLTAYLLEAWPEQTRAFIGKVGRGAEEMPQLTKLLQMEPEVLQARLRRWLSERR